MTAAEQAATLRFAADLLDQLVDLPVAFAEVSPHHPTVLQLHVHGGFGAFEQWREALGIPEADVSIRESASQATMHGGGECPGGITVQLTGYSSPVVAW